MLPEILEEGRGKEEDGRGAIERRGDNGEVIARASEFVFEHEKLAVYHKAVAVAVRLREVADALPDRCGDLRSQLRRAAASIPLNLAEGANEYSQDEKSRFYRMARRSGGECAAILDLVAGLTQRPDMVLGAKSQLNEVVAWLTRLIHAQTGER